MTDLKHTPGPWHWVETEGKGFEVNDASDDLTVASHMTQADARLIAAAPELLAAGRELSELADSLAILFPEERILQRSVLKKLLDSTEKMNAAIAKAERERVAALAKEEDESRALKRAKEKEEAEKLYRELLAGARDDFLQGRLIGWEYFEALCREHGIKIHMRTMGMARKKCAEIGLTSCRIAGGKAGQLFDYARALDSALRT